MQHISGFPTLAYPQKNCELLADAKHLMSFWPFLTTGMSKCFYEWLLKLCCSINGFKFNFGIKSRTLSQCQCFKNSGMNHSFQENSSSPSPINSGAILRGTYVFLTSERISGSAKYYRKPVIKKFYTIMKNLLHK